MIAGHEGIGEILGGTLPFSVAERWRHRRSMRGPCCPRPQLARVHRASTPHSEASTRLVKQCAHPPISRPRRKLRSQRVSIDVFGVCQVRYPLAESSRWQILGGALHLEYLESRMNHQADPKLPEAREFPEPTRLSMLGWHLLPNQVLDFPQSSKSRTADFHRSSN